MDSLAGGRRGQNCDLPVVPIQGLYSGRGRRLQRFAVRSADKRSMSRRRLQGGSSSGAVKRPASSGAVKRPAAAVNTAFEDMENVQPLAPIEKSGYRRAASSGPSSTLKPSGQSTTLYAILGVGGAVVGLLLVTLIVVLTRGGGDAGAGKRPAVAESPAPSPVETVAAPSPAVTATSYSADTSLRQIPPPSTARKLSADSKRRPSTSRTTLGARRSGPVPAL